MRKLGIVALVCVGLLAFTQGLQFLLSSFATAVFTIEGGAVLSGIFIGTLALLGAASTLAIGALLIARRKSLAERWFEDGEIGVDVDAVDLLRIAFIVMGVSIGISAITKMLYSIGDPLALAAYEQAVLGGSSGEASGMVLVRIAPPAVVGLLQLGLGAFLVMRSEAISRRLWQGSQAVPVAAEPQLKSCPECGSTYDPDDYEGDPADWHCVECHARLRPDDA